MDHGALTMSERIKDAPQFENRKLRYFSCKKVRRAGGGGGGGGGRGHLGERALAPPAQVDAKERNKRKSLTSVPKPFLSAELMDHSTQEP